MTTPNNLKYAKSHEWARLEADGQVSVGISDHAQDALGDIVFIELPEIGREVRATEECAVVESVKAASDIYAPLAGTITAVNTAVADAPELVNQAPYDNWLFRLQPVNAADLDTLLDAAAYAAVAESE